MDLTAVTSKFDELRAEIDAADDLAKSGVRTLNEDQLIDFRSKIEAVKDKCDDVLEEVEEMIDDEEDERGKASFAEISSAEDADKDHTVFNLLVARIAMLTGESTDTIISKAHDSAGVAIAKPVPDAPNLKDTTQDGGSAPAVDAIQLDPNQVKATEPGDAVGNDQTYPAEVGPGPAVVVDPNASDEDGDKVLATDNTTPQNKIGADILS